MESALSAVVWEMLYAPYDQPTYQAVLDWIQPNDILLDIGAGDLRLSKQMATLARMMIMVATTVHSTPNPAITTQKRRGRGIK